MSTFFAILFWFSATVLVVGLTLRIKLYWSTPAPLKIPITPAPVTTTGVILRMTRETVLFESLFKANKWIWLFGWMFHASLFIVLARHLRYFQEQPWLWVYLIQPFSHYAAFTMIIGLAGLLARRILVDRMRYISAPSDFLMLILLGFIGLSGLTMQLFVPTNIIAVQTFFTGLMDFNIQHLPLNLALTAHLISVALLMLIFPFSKLLHAPGVFFSPTLNQVDNPREKRHISRWAKALERKD